MHLLLWLRLHLRQLICKNIVVLIPGLVLWTIFVSTPWVPLLWTLLLILLSLSDLKLVLIFKTAVPTFLDGAAHQEGRSLDSIRRELGYFRPSSIENQWTGGSELQTLQLKPDEGPVRATQAKGVITIGATRWVDNYNIPVFTNDISIVSKIAKRVGGRGGGLPSVQSMALTHGGGTIEVACNLLEPARIGGDQVQLEVERLAK